MSDDDGVRLALEHAEAEVAALEGRLEAWRKEDELACEALAMERATADRAAAEVKAQLSATRDRLAKMVREEKSLLGWRGVTWKGVQLAIRLLLSLCVALAFLMFTTNDELSGWPIFAVMVADAAVVWFLGDLADYLELAHG